MKDFKIIPTKIHGVLDYLTGSLICASPWLFNFNIEGSAREITVLLGIVTIVMSAMTNYELGLFKILTMDTHLLIDILISIFLILSPWIFGFSRYIFLPQVVFGIIGIGVALFTDRVPYRRKQSLSI
ncbi:MAG: hypothetical protein H0W61_12675 [Bacteroidetes bacterium]|nr:hypothetical protein [Bacteroidota bacterium]